MPDSNSAHDPHVDDEDDHPTLVTRFKEIDANIRDFARQQPMLAALAALSAGYLVGRALRKL